MPVTIHGTAVLSGAINNANSFSGAGDSKQSDTLAGNIAVTVIKRLSNGNLMIEGQREIDLNQGSEYIKLQGIIRPIDIASDNTIPSTEVADARIAYGQHGALNDANAPGLLSRFFNLSVAAFLNGVNVNFTDDNRRARRRYMYWPSLALALAYLLGAAGTARAERVEDLATVAGVRSNQLIGYGLVVGLDGTGDQTTQTPFTIQSIENMLAQFGVVVPSNTNPMLQNVAAVTVHASLPPFAKPGQTIDVTVDSIGNAKSLRGGSLVMTPLRGADGQVYAMAQGSVLVSGFGIEAQGRLEHHREHSEQRASPQRRHGGAVGTQQLRHHSLRDAESRHPRFHDRHAAHGCRQQASRHWNGPGARCGFGACARARRCKSADRLRRDAGRHRYRPGDTARARDHQFPHGYRGHQFGSARDGRGRGQRFPHRHHHGTIRCQPAQRIQQWIDRRHAPKQCST